MVWGGVGWGWVGLDGVGWCEVGLGGVVGWGWVGLGGVGWGWMVLDGRGVEWCGGVGWCGVGLGGVGWCWVLLGCCWGVVGVLLGCTIIGVILPSGCGLVTGKNRIIVRRMSVVLNSTAGVLWVHFSS